MDNNVNFKASGSYAGVAVAVDTGDTRQPANQPPQVAAPPFTLFGMSATMLLGIAGLYFVAKKL